MNDPTVRHPEFDLDRASALLDEAGWQLSDEDGWRYKTIDGEGVRFTFVLSIPQTFADAVKMAAIYQRDLKRIGIDLTTETVEGATLEDRIQRHEFQVHAAALENATDPDDWSNYLETSMYQKGRNYGGYSNPRVDELMEIGRRALVREERAVAYKEVHRLTNEDQPLLVLWNYADIRALSKRLRGIEQTPVGTFLFLGAPPPGSGWFTGPGWWVHKDDA